MCCTSDWDVPVELPIYRTLDAALRHRTLSPMAPAYGGDPALITGDDLPDGAAAMLARTDTGDCVFFHRSSHLCAIHRDGGEAMLPATCRHFPRLAVRDARGTFISLTHFCPTAAAMLFRPDAGLSIVEGPSAFPVMDYEGLSVAPEEWPPLLHPRMLMDYEGYSAWERHMVDRCADPAASPESVLATLRRDAEDLCRFVPGSMTLAQYIERLPSTFVASATEPSLDRSLALRESVRASIPDDLKPIVDDAGLEEAYRHFVAPFWDGWRVPLNRYLAAKAFANWTAYQGRGVRALVHGLDVALALVRIEASRQCRNAGAGLQAALLLEAIRAAEFSLNHLAVGEELADAWSKAVEL